MFDGSIRKKNAVVRFVRRLFPYGSFENLPSALPVFRMNPIEEDLCVGCSIRIGPIYSMNLGRGYHGPRSNVAFKTPGVTQPLGLQQAFLTASEVLCRRLAFIDVRM